VSSNIIFGKEGEFKHPSKEKDGGKNGLSELRGFVGEFKRKEKSLRSHNI
jgi:hypothetical protein